MTANSWSIMETNKIEESILHKYVQNPWMIGLNILLALKPSRILYELIKSSESSIHVLLGNK